MDSQNNRKKNIKKKLNVVKNIVLNKNILIVDDSIVRGNTIKYIIDLLKNNNVNKIYIVSGAPEIINTNIYGIDVPNKEQLISYSKNNKELKEYLNVDEIIFQDLENLKKSIQFFNPNIKDFELSMFIK